MKVFMAGGGDREFETSLERYMQGNAGRQELCERQGGSDAGFLGGGGVKALDTGRTPRISKKKRNANISCGTERDAQNPQRAMEGRCKYTLQEFGRGEMGGGYDSTVKEYRPFILESFYYADADTERLLPYFGDFLLDSGAFTFMSGNGTKTDWDEYVERYADFINRNRVNKFFELDIDCVTGYARVKELRRKLEKLTNKPSIPVWHVSRGLDEYKAMCDAYDYVAIGGIVSGEITKDKYKAFPILINEAHQRKAKVHGLGFTNLALLPKYHFDSVDSTAWTTGNRFGFLYYFDGRTMQKKDAPRGHRIGQSRAAALNNYTEWIKFQKWAITHL